MKKNHRNLQALMLIGVVASAQLASAQEGSIPAPLPTDANAAPTIVMAQPDGGFGTYQMSTSQVGSGGRGTTYQMSTADVTSGPAVPTYQTYAGAPSCTSGGCGVTNVVYTTNGGVVQAPQTSAGCASVPANLQWQRYNDGRTLAYQNNRWYQSSQGQTVLIQSQGRAVNYPACQSVISQPSNCGKVSLPSCGVKAWRRAR